MNWWSGEYAAMQPAPPAHAHAGSPVPPRAGRRPAGKPGDLPSPTDYFAARDAVPAMGHPVRPGARTAAEIRANAMRRVKQRQTAAARRRAGHSKPFNTSPNAGVIAAVVLFLLAVGAIVVMFAPSAFIVDFERGFTAATNDVENPTPSAGSPAPQTRVLLLNDRRATATPEEAQWLRDAASALSKAGYPILGLGTDPSELELIARARTRLNGAAPDDAQAWATLRAWLDDSANTEHDLSAILWVPIDTEEPWRIIQGEGFEGDVRSRFLQTLINATNGNARPMVISHGPQ